MRPHNPARARGRWVVRLLVVMAVVYVLEALLLAFVLVVDPASLTPDVLELVAGVEALIAMGSLLGLVATGVAFLAWLHAAVSNIAPLHGGQPDVSPNASVLWWFVPFANFVMPYRAVRQLFERPLPGEDAGRLVVGWWLLWLGGNLAAVFSDRWIGGARDLDAIRASLVVAIGAELATVAAAFFAITIIQRVNRRQDRLLEAEMAAAYSVPPTWTSSGAR